MKVLLLGATGMVGRGVLRECLLDPAIDSVLVVTRGATGERHPKLRELIRSDMSQLGDVMAQLAPHDACFFCLGVSSVGMSEADYHRVTYELTMAVARPLAEANPMMTFLFVSGAGTDSSERGRAMWARVKGKTENALLALPFKAAFMFRPAFIQPLHGIVPKTRWLRIVYAIAGRFYWLWKRIFPRYVTTTEAVGRAMIAVARRGAPRKLLENSDINALGAGPRGPALPAG